MSSCPHQVATSLTGVKWQGPILFFPLGLHDLCLSQCPGGHLPTLLFTNTPSLPRPAPVAYGCMIEREHTQPLTGGWEAGFGAGESTRLSPPMDMQSGPGPPDLALPGCRQKYWSQVLEY